MYIYIIQRYILLQGSSFKSIQKIGGDTLMRLDSATQFQPGRPYFFVRRKKYYFFCSEAHRRVRLRSRNSTWGLDQPMADLRITIEMCRNSLHISLGTGGSTCLNVSRSTQIPSGSKAFQFYSCKRNKILLL